MHTYWILQFEIWCHYVFFFVVLLICLILMRDVFANRGEIARKINWLLLTHLTVFVCSFKLIFFYILFIYNCFCAQIMLSISLYANYVVSLFVFFIALYLYFFSYLSCSFHIFPRNFLLLFCVLLLFFKKSHQFLINDNLIDLIVV